MSKCKKTTEERTRTMATRSDDDSGRDGRISGDRGRVLIPPDAAARVPSSEAWEQLPDLPR